MAAPELNVRANATLDDLYRRHVGDVYRYTYAVLGNHADAEDVTQTTFVNALRALERGDLPRDPSNWLLAISHNIVRQRWRQAAVRPTEVELVADVPDESTEPDVELDELVRALQRIPPAQREALVMRELEGRSYNEISELLGLTISALETLLFRARRSLAEELENIVTCQSAELAMSKQLDGRLSRKERRRLDEHLAECDACAKLAETQRRQRRAFKGLAVLPVPVGLALFKGVPTASAATLPTIGIGATGSGTGVGATGVGAGGATAAASGTVTGGSILGGAVAKVAAVVIAGTVATGVGYEGVKALTSDAKPTPARSSDERAATPSSRAATPATVPATTLSGRRDVGTSFAPSGGSSGSTSSPGSSIAANPAKQPLDDSPVAPTDSGTGNAGNAAAPPDTTPRKSPKSSPPATTPPATTPPETTPPVATPTPPETPAGPPASAPPESPGASGSTPPATSTGTSPTGSGGSGGRSACPAGGSGPGNGGGCGLARGHEREAPTPAAPVTPAPSTPAPETTPPPVATEPGAGRPESAGPSVGESMSDTHADKSDK
jgi:RNA polymerase sigma factor (sigma-70 family)